jgi:predicted nucleic acid-binding protein
MKVIFDTNVLLDVVEKREPHFPDSYKVFMKSARNEMEAIIGAGSITDIYYIIKKNCKNAQQALGYIIDMIKIVTPVDTKAGDIQEAIKMGFSDFEDAVVTAIATREKADYILTRNVDDFIKSPIPAILPADFLTMVTGSDVK